MATGRITKSNVDALKPGDGDQYLWDDKISGFGIKVTPIGAKTYLFQYRLGGRAGKTRRVTIGKHGSLTPDKARREAEGLTLLIAQGIDPQQDKQDRQRKAIDLAFKPYVERFIEDCLKIKWKASYNDGASVLRRYAVPVLGNKPLPEVNRADIRAVLTPVRQKVATCRNLYAVLRRLFRWAVSEGDLSVSPITGMEPPPLPPKRDRVLSGNELRLVWRGSDKMEYPFGPFVRLLVITGQRLEEVAALPWAELDRAEAMWSLPSERSKNSNATRVPLSLLAIAELDALAMRAGRHDGWPRRGLVFTTTGETPISGFSRAKKRLDKEAATLGQQVTEAMTLPHWRFHDLRRTLATGMQRLGVRFEVTEAIMNHVSGAKSGVAGVYQLHDWGPEKKAALQAWSDHVERLLSGADTDNVVRLATRV